jgi:hypothetical protein
VSHLEYADETIIMTKPTKDGITNLIFLLLCFENMCGLKINLSKSEVVVLGEDQREQ